MSNANRREQLRQQQMAQAAQARTRRLIGIGVGVVALALVVVMVWVALTQMSNSGTSGQVPNAVNGASVLVNPGKAKAGAKKVTLYVDYQCPICKKFEESYGPVVQQMADAGEIEYHVTVMTFMDNNLKNTASTRAAVAATCTDASGKFLQATQEIFKQQEAEEIPGSIGYTDDFLKTQLPTSLGITGDQLSTYQQCYTSRATKGLTESMNKAAYDAGVTSTPTLTVNGTKVQFPNPGTVDPQAIRQIIEQAS